MKISGWQVRASVGALSLVVLGVILGVVADRVWLAHGHRPAVVMAESTPAMDHSAMLAFRDVLELEEDQMVAIHEILLRNQVRVDEAWQSIRVHVSEGVEKAHEEIRELLTEEQQRLFEAWLDRHVRGGHDEDHTLLWNH